MTFSHLFVRSGYSFLKSTVKLKELIEQAKQYNIQAVALTDEQVLHGAVQFYQLAIEAGIKPIIGMIVYVTEETGGTTPITVLAKNNQGYQDLLKLSTALNVAGETSLSLPELAGYTEHVHVILPITSSPIASFLQTGEEALIKNYLNNWNQLLHKEVCIGVDRKQRLSFPILKQIVKQLPNQAIAIQDVRYLRQEDQQAYRCLRAMDQGTTWTSMQQNQDNNDHHFATSEEVHHWFQDWPELIEETNQLANTCNISLELHVHALPKYPLESGHTASSYLSELCEQALEKKYPDANQVVRNRMNHELQVITNMGFSDYFLIVWDFVQYAKNNNIMVGPGRGSAAGSLVAYLLNITEIDPIKYQLLFERFLNPERISMPDIDIDFSDTRRDEVIAYVQQKYGQDHVAQIGTFGTFATRSTIRELAKVMEISPEDLAFILKEIPSHSSKSVVESVKGSILLRDYIKTSPKLQQFFTVATKLEGLPRHLSTHAAGIIISEEPLVNRVALTASHESIYLTQFAMKDVETIGLLKMDFLGLRNLTLIERILQSIKKSTKDDLDIHHLPLHDKRTFELLQHAKTNGIFQLESQGMQGVLQQLHPTTFEDIVAVNALYRPGPMAFISTYINRKHGKEQVTYPHPDLQPILQSTYGVLVYQEQIMQIANQLAGFSLGQADLLRRAVSKKNENEIKQLEQTFLDGCVRNGYDRKVATDVFDWIVRFSNYGFNRSHAVAYSKISYQLAFLKAHHAANFFAEILSSMAGQQDKVRIYTNEAQTFGLSLLPPSINKSFGKFHVEANQIRVGLWAIKGVGHQVINHIIEIRKNGSFRSLFDFCMRVSLKIINRSVIESLILAGAFDALFSDRASLLATIDHAMEQAELFNEFDDQSSLFQDELELDINYVQVKPFSDLQQLKYEKDLIGIYISSHPLQKYRKSLREHGFVTLAKVKTLVNKNKQQIAAIIQSIKVIRTKRGDQMAFLIIADESVELEAVIFPNLFREIKPWLSEELLVAMTGKVEGRNGKLQFIINEVEQLDMASLQKKALARIYIKLEAENEQQALSHLNQLAEQYPGSAAVIIYHSRTDQTYQLASSYNLKIERGCIQTLNNIFGKSNVVIKQHNET